MYDQQGDVLLKKVDSLPNKQFKITESKKVILAEGEQTGHKHVLNALSSPVKVYEADNEVFVEIFSQAEIIHQEHKKIKQYGDHYLPGLYKIEIVREYDHLTEETRRVLD